MIASNTPMTPEQLFALPDSKGLEIVRGKIVEKRMGFESSKIGFRLSVILGSFCLQHRLGHMTASEGGFRCFPDDETKTRKPDLAFVSFARLPETEWVGAYCKVAPDFVIEVLSPNDEVKDISDRVRDFLNVGTVLIWVVDEFLRQVVVYSSAAPPRIYTLQDELTAEPVMPGFRCRVSEIFEGIPRGK